MPINFDEEDVKQLRKCVAELEKENAALRAKIPVKKEVELTYASKQILVVLFKTENDRPTDAYVPAPTLAEVLKMERRLLQYHLDRLFEANLIRRTNVDFYTKEYHYRLSEQGRRCVVENNLV